MNNLTKHEVLKHRHLSLLKKLEDAGITAKCDNDGEWNISNSSAHCDVCMGTGRFLPHPDVTSVPCPAKGCPFRIDITVEECKVKFDSRFSFGGFPPHYSSQCTYDPSATVEEYVRERYLLRADGKVTFARDSEANIPDWVAGFDKEHGRASKGPFPPPPGWKVNDTYQAVYGMDIRAFLDAGWDVEMMKKYGMLVPDEATTSLPSGDTVTLTEHTVELIRHRKYRPVAKYKMAFARDSLVWHLLDALKAAIVAASPAKVD